MLYILLGLLTLGAVVLGLWFRRPPSQDWTALGRFVGSFPILSHREQIQLVVWAINLVRLRVPILPARTLPNPELLVVLPRFLPSSSWLKSIQDKQPGEKVARFVLQLTELALVLCTLTYQPPLPRSLFAAVLIELLLARLAHLPPPATISDFAEELSKRLELPNPNSARALLTEQLAALCQAADQAEGQP